MFSEIAFLEIAQASLHTTCAVVNVVFTPLVEVDRSQCSFVNRIRERERERESHVSSLHRIVRSGTLNYSPAPIHPPTAQPLFPPSPINLPSQAPLNDKVGLEPLTVALVFVNKRFQNLLIILLDCDLAVFNKMLYSKSITNIVK